MDCKWLLLIGGMRLVRKKKGIKIVLICVVTLLVVMCLAAVVFVAVQISKAPDISQVNATPEGYLTTIYDKDGQEMEKLYVTESNRIYVELEEIPDSMEKAFVAIEDERFYNHMGIDIRGIIRAAVKGVAAGHFSGQIRR